MLTQTELEKIEGYEVVENIDKLKLDVCVRNGTQMVIHADTVAYWRSQPSQFSDRFEEMYKHHMSKYADKVASLCPKDDTNNKQSKDADTAAAEGQLDSKADDEGSMEAPEEFDSVDKMPEKVSKRQPSDEHDVEILEGSGGSVFLISKKGKSMARYTQIAGVGQGRFVPVESEETGVHDHNPSISFS